MNRKKEKTNWQSVVRKAVSQDRKYKRPLPNEWKDFSKFEIDILLRLEDDDVSISYIIEEFNFSKWLEKGSEAFLEQCLTTCISRNSKHIFETKFLPLLHLINELIDDEGGWLDGLDTFIEDYSPSWPGSVFNLLDDRYINIVSKYQKLIKK